MKKLIAIFIALCVATSFGSALAKESSSANHKTHASKSTHNKHAKKSGAHKKSSNKTSHKKHKKPQA